MRFNWTSKTIETMEDLKEATKLCKRIKPEAIGFDTETTGLHIALDKPFVIQWGFYDLDTHQGYTFAVDREKNAHLAEQCVLVMHQLAKRAKFLVGHNVKFDLHMLANIGLPYPYKNVTDTQILIRLGSPALTVEKGGEPLGLKEYASRHVDKDAKFHEKLLKSERTSISKQYNTQLKKMLAAKGINWKDIMAVIEDDILDTEDLPKEALEVYHQWYNTIPEAIKEKMEGTLIESDDVPYTMLNRKALLEYAHLDIVYTLEIYYILAQVVPNIMQSDTWERENKVLIPFYKMERVGFYMDKEYIRESKIKLKAYILRRRQELYQMAGRKISVGQHAAIKQILSEKYHLEVVGTGTDVLDEEVQRLKAIDSNNPVIEFIDTIQELRTLSKWYVTYLKRFVKQMHKCDRVYTQINQAAAVTGRVSSDFQQFPKKAIQDTEGNDLFQPRRMVIKSPESVGLLFLDYSQVELRLQALYTILVGDPDLNLCRAYMPYKCINLMTNKLFDYTDENDIKNWDSGQWVYEENPEHHWEPTDVHAATTQKAFPNLDPKSKEFKSLRSIVGKRVNFAKNYGAQRGKIRTMFPERTEEEITMIDSAYYAAFPGVKTYHTYCYDLVRRQDYGMNLFGRRYYGMSGHNLINSNVQGSGADFLKDRIIALNEYMEANNVKSRMQMNIHDEISWELAEGEEYLFAEFKKIMQNFEGTLVPIVAEGDFTATTWADKAGIQSVEEITKIIKENVNV